MYYPIEDIDGFSERLRTLLIRSGVRTTRHLLERGATSTGRATLAAATGATEAEVLAAVQIADLMRVKGCGAGYAVLLQAAGVTSVAVLARRDARTLHARLVAARPLAPRVRRSPTLAQVAACIEDAGALQPIVT